MWLYFKAINEAHKMWDKRDWQYGPYTAEYGIDYALTNHPMFLLETFIEACWIVFLLVKFFGV